MNSITGGRRTITSFKCESDCSRSLPSSVEAQFNQREIILQQITPADSLGVLQPFFGAKRLDLSLLEAGQELIPGSSLFIFLKYLEYAVAEHQDQKSVV